MVGASVALEAEGGSSWQGTREGLTWASEPGCSTGNLINKRATFMVHQCIPDPCEAGSAQASIWGFSLGGTEP